jgi:hypothetical protein
MTKKEAKEKYDELANSDFSKMSTEQIKLNITGRLKYLNIYLNPKTK